MNVFIFFLQLFCCFRCNNPELVKSHNRYSMH